MRGNAQIQEAKGLLSFPKRYASPRALYMFSGMLSEVPGPASAEIGIATPDLKKSLSEQYV